IIHLGDTSADGNYIRGKYPDKTVVINGNCEVFCVGEKEKVLDIEGVKIFACHGHMYSVKTTLSRLAKRAKELGCDIALYGHTHDAREDEIDGVTLLNPGTLSRYAEKSYLYIVIYDGKFTQKIVRIN
ncbi:MAG: YfcE family phosphodiesterase, partial [Clostridia bacterium]|nr:YfcE family phosphodiesterase [Clostridia bacterium]